MSLLAFSKKEIAGRFPLSAYHVVGAHLSPESPKGRFCPICWELLPILIGPGNFCENTFKRFERRISF